MHRVGNWVRRYSICWSSSGWLFRRKARCCSRWSSVTVCLVIFTIYGIVSIFGYFVRDGYCLEWTIRHYFRLMQFLDLLWFCLCQRESSIQIIMNSDLLNGLCCYLDKGELYPQSGLINYYYSIFHLLTRLVINIISYKLSIIIFHNIKY